MGKDTANYDYNPVGDSLDSRTNMKHNTAVSNRCITGRGARADSCWHQRGAMLTRMTEKRSGQFRPEAQMFIIWIMRDLGCHQFQAFERSGIQTSCSELQNEEQDYEPRTNLSPKTLVPLKALSQDRFLPLHALRSGDSAETCLEFSPSSCFAACFPEEILSSTLEMTTHSSTTTLEPLSYCLSELT